jgi:hypothetical protein
VTPHEGEPLGEDLATPDESTQSEESADGEATDGEPADDTATSVDDDGVIIEDDGDGEDPAAAEARRTVLGEDVPESAITVQETERGDAVEYEIDRDAIPFSEDVPGDVEPPDDDDDDEDGFLSRLFRS